MNLGNPPERVDCVLSTERLAGIIDYEPTDLVLSVGAGARFGDVQAVLAEHGQRLPLDPPGGADATIGGLIATGRWGPLRYSAGTLRDLLIGIAVAHPSGTVSKAGGMVVKNVSGYDMPRLYLGSLGTLGVVVSANFKVLPRPRAEATVIATYDEPAKAFSTASALRNGREPIAALEVAFLDGAWHLAARIEGRDETVAAVAGRISAIAGGDVNRVDGPESADWWASYVAKQQIAHDENAVLVRCGARPKETAVLATDMAAALSEFGVATPYLAASPGLGAVVARLDFGNEGSAAFLADAARRPARSCRHRDDPGRAAIVETWHRRLGATPGRIRCDAVAARAIRSQAHDQSRPVRRISVITCNGGGLTTLPEEFPFMAVAIETDANLMRLGGFSGSDIPEDDLLRACVHCGMCLSSCPTYRLTGQEMSSPRGRLWLMRAVADERLDLLDPLFDEQMYQCLNCRACEAVCPSGVHYGPLVEASRAQLEQHRPRPLPERALRRAGLDWLFADSRRLRLLVRMLRLSEKSGLTALARKTGLLKLLGMEELQALTPEISRRPLVPGNERWPADPVDNESRAARLFNGCIMGTVFANTNRAAARVMARNGADVDVPVEQQCCGALHVHAGMMDEARVLARKNIDAFAAIRRRPDHRHRRRLRRRAQGVWLPAEGRSRLRRARAAIQRSRARFHRVSRRARARAADQTRSTHGDLPGAVSSRPRPAHQPPATRLDEGDPRARAGRDEGKSSLCCGSAGIYNIIREEMANELGDRKALHAMETAGDRGHHRQPGLPDAGTRVPAPQRQQS